MARPAILAIDQGTTNTQALLVALDGAILSTGSVPTGLTHPRPGWVEQSGEGILGSVEAAIAQALAGADDVEGGAEIIAIGISNQRETVLTWDAASGNAAGPCVTWQCRRSAPLCAALRAAGHAEVIEQLSGLQLDPVFSAGKLRWLIENADGAADLIAEDRLRAGTVDSWLLWHLTSGTAHATDASNASRTQLLGLDCGDWDDELLRLFGVPRSILPEVMASDALFGHTAGGLAGLPDGIPIHAMMGDSHAALFGHAITARKRVKVTLGTGSSLMCPTGARAKSRSGLSSTVAWRQRGTTVFALEGNIAVSGHSAAFGAKLLGLSGPEELTRLASTVPGSEGVVVVPALAGLGAPYWDEQARGIICGLSLGSEPAHVAYAFLESIAHQICDLVAAIEDDLGSALEAICVDGSAARSDVLMQMLADLAGRKVGRPAQTELSAIGAAMMAAAGIGRTISDALVAKDRTFNPAMAADRRVLLRSRWRAAVERARTPISS